MIHKFISTLSLICFVFFGNAVFSQTKIISTTQDFIHEISTQNNEGQHFVSLETSSGEKLNIQFDDFYRAENRISATGKIEGQEESFVLFKINSASVYGYIVNERKAYKYTSNNGKVQVENASVGEFFPDLHDKEFLEANTPGVHHHEEDELHHKKSDNKVVQKSLSLASYPHLSDYTANTDLQALQSLPGSQYVIYLDIRDVMNGNTPKHVSKEIMYDIWKGTATAFVAFNVNVTTDINVYNSVPVVNSCIAKLLDEDGRSFAPLNSFGTTKQASIFRHTEAKGYASTTIHEIGHQLGLSHDGGGSGGQYFEGIKQFSWNSYMGNYYLTTFNQWSKGEYAGANNQQDDLVIITGYIPYRADDNSNATPLQFQPGSTTVPAELNVGSIEKNTDEDVYTFSLSNAGVLSLKIEPMEYLTLLDIDARIEDENGTVLIQKNTSLERYVEFKNFIFFNAGNYKLIIKGGAEGTPQNGFSNYSSYGVYGISGQVAELPQSNLIIDKVNELSGACSKTTPSVRIRNLGLGEIQNVEFAVSIAGGADQTVNVANLNIPSLEYADIALPDVTTVGENVVYKVKGVKVNGVSPLWDEEKSTVYTLREGQEVELAVSTPTSSFLGWSIKKNGTKVVDAQDVVKTTNEGGYDKMRFCVLEGCYDFEVKHVYDNCSATGSNVGAWSSSNTYNAGAVVHYNGLKYKAKWWATGSNVPGTGGPWEAVGSCEVTQSGDFILKTIEGNNTLAQQNITPSDELSLDFCTSSLTGASFVDHQNNGLRYKPNPFSRYLTIEVEEGDIQEVLIFNASGNNVASKVSVYSKSIQLGEDLLSGVYTVKVRGTKKSYNFKVIKL